MAEGVRGRPDLRRPARAGRLRPTLRPAAWPWWVQVIAVAALARGASAAVLVAVARTQEPTPWAGAAPSYAQFVGLFWDASWYREIAERGYPAQLPRGADGAVLQNAWAFFPLFPVLVRPLLALGLPWQVAAPALATALGVAALLVVHRVVATLVEDRVAATTAEYRGAGASGAVRGVPLLAVALVATYPAAPVLQAAYTESLALLLVAALLLALLRRRYGLVLVLAPLLGLTRAVALPMALVVVAHGLDRVRRARSGEPFAARDRGMVLAAGAVTTLAGLLWPALVGLATGEPDAYALTQGAWRGRGDVVPLVPWWDVAVYLVGVPAAPLLLAVVVLALAGLLAWPRLRSWGAEAWTWVAAYLGYLVVVLEPGTSLVRFGLLAFPVAAAASSAALTRRTTAGRTVAVVVLLAVGLVGQVLWVELLWRLVPPSGWPP